jgi:hypothetical protein
MKVNQIKKLNLRIVHLNEQERSRVEVKASKIPKAGNGVFALFDFAKGDVVSEFLGKKCKTRDEVCTPYTLANHTCID